MDELEITELMLSEVLEENEDFRFHSEYFKKKYLRNLDHISKFDVKYLKEISVVADGDHSKFPENQKEEVLYLQAKDIKSNFLQVENPVHVSKEYFFKNKRSTIKPESILISIMGNVGDIAITPKNFEPCMANRALAILRDIKSINAYFLFVYLISKSAFLEIERIKNGGVQERINLDILGKIPIPILPQPFQSHIADLVQTAHSKLEESKKLYLQAEQILLVELGIPNIKDANSLEDKPPISNEVDPLEGVRQKLNISVKKFSESFGVSGRLDAEYYQPKYDEVLKKIRQFKHLNLGGEDGLVDIFKSIEPGSEAYQENGIPFVRVSNLNKNEISEPEIKLNEKQFGHIKKPKKDDILLSKDGSVGLAYKCQKDENFITSGAILHLTIKNTDLILPDYLTLVLNSKIVQLQAQRDAGGSIIQHWKPSEIEAVLIPLLPSQTQSQIAEFIQTSFKLRTESKELLERAKLEVEEEVEKG